MGGEGPPQAPAEQMAPEGHEREKEAERAAAGYSGTGFGVPEAPRGGGREGDSALPNKSGSALLVLRMRSGSAAQANQTCAAD